MAVSFQKLCEQLGVRRVGSALQARCPAHDDKEPSLSIATHDGRILLHCHAGCSVESICEALRIKVSDLFIDSNDRIPPSKIVATYDYRDESGLLLYQNVRFEPKDFRMRRPDGVGAWRWGLNGIRRVPYRLREVISSNFVLLVEGEKDSDAAEKLGFVATSSKHWRPEFAAHLQGKTVAIIADADAAGRKIANGIAKMLAGKVASLKVFELPGSKDLFDWIAVGGTREALDGFIETIPEWKFAESQQTTGPSRVVEVALESYDRIRKDHLRYWWPQYLPKGKLVHVGGNSGEGKTPVAVDLAARISTAAEWPDGTPNTIGPRSVILLMAEDDPEDTIKPRLELAGADMTKIYRVVTTLHTEQNAQEKMLSLSADLDKLLETARSLKDLAVIVIDPVTNYLGTNVKMNAEDEVRAVLMPLALATAELNVTTITIGHLNRRERGTEALHRLMGAAAFGGVARFIYLVGADPLDIDRHTHVLVQRRGVDAPALRYRTFLKNVTWDGETSGVVGVEWLGKSTATAEDVVDPRSSDEKSATARAAVALVEILKKGRVPVKTALAQLKDAGHDTETLNQTRLLRAAHAESKRFAGEKNWSWYLPTLFTEAE